MSPSPPSWLIHLRIYQLPTGLTTRPMWPRQAWRMTLRRLQNMRNRCRRLRT
ncbi:hypothetical protein AAY473_012349 [Plecturocebus cupreus]